MPTFTTSGSTRTPKSIEMSDELLAARAKARTESRRLVFGNIRSLFCDLSIKSAAGAAYELWARDSAIRFFSTGGGTLESTLALFQQEEIEGIVGNPVALVNFASIGMTHRFKAILSTGAMLSPHQLHIIQKGLGTNVWSSYGATEVGSIALASPGHIESELGCVGNPCPGVEIALDGNEVRVRTQTMISGYPDPELTAKHFRDGWFYPGDLGHFNAAGLLVLEGRVPQVD